MDWPDIHVHGAGTALPGPPLDNRTLIERFALPAVWEQWIDTYVGIRNRHFCVDIDTGEVRHTLADLAETAARRALTAAGARPADVDLLVLGTATPDLLMPATVNQVADRLGIDGVATYQLQSGCTGAVQALSVAYHLLRSGPHRTALVLGGDRCAKHLDLTVDVASRPRSEQVNGMLFGDGAGALVLSTDSGEDTAVLRHVHVELAGLNRPPGQVLEWFGKADSGVDRPAVSEDYKAIEESVPKLAVEALRHVLDELGWDDGEVDYLLPPQLSGVMTTRIAEELAVPTAQEISCVAEIGNTGNALPFFQLRDTLPRLTTGDRVVAIAVESSKWIKAGFALEKA
jgi:3-oxoacyl-[acyl-carrier-protein] synthase-3